MSFYHDLPCSELNELWVSSAPTDVRGVSRIKQKRLEKKKLLNKGAE